MSRLENIFKQMVEEFFLPTSPLQYRLIANIEVGSGPKRKMYLTNLDFNAFNTCNLRVGTNSLTCCLSLAVFTSSEPQEVEIAYSQIHTVMRNQELIYERSAVAERFKKSQELTAGA